MCVLYDHLIRRKDAAQVRTEIREVERLERELREHVERCAVCRAQSMARLNELFKNQVVVTEAK